MITFENVTELEAWLTANGIDTSCWGTGGAKTVENLWSELAEGESELHADPPRRQVRIVSVTICRGRRTLVEVGQAFGENQYRYRHMPPTEKLKPGETQIEAAVRCLHEELGISSHRIKILSWMTEPEQWLQDSPSYPGLTTKYLRYKVEVKVSGLPTHPFSTTETVREDGDPVRSHQWLWKSKE